MLAASMPWSQWTPDHTRILVESYVGSLPRPDVLRRVLSQAQRIHEKGSGTRKPCSGAPPLKS
jgi:hypothetical protein